MLLYTLDIPVYETVNCCGVDEQLQSVPITVDQIITNYYSIKLLLLYVTACVNTLFKFHRHLFLLLQF